MDAIQHLIEVDILRRVVCFSIRLLTRTVVVRGHALIHVEMQVLDVNGKERSTKRACRHRLVLLLSLLFFLCPGRKRNLYYLASFSISLIISSRVMLFSFLFSIVFLTFCSFLLPLCFLIIQRHMVLF